MKKFVSFFLVISLPLGYYTSSQDKIYWDVLRTLETFGEAYKHILFYYVDSLDASKLISYGINGMLRSLDPYSRFIEYDEESEIDLLTDESYGGIGVVIDARGDELIVIEVMPGYTAQRQGIRVGDVIVAIDDETVTSGNISRLIKKVRGKPGTELKLTIRREGEKNLLEFHLVREKIKLVSISQVNFLTEEEGILYVKIDRFSKRVSQEFFEKVREAKKKDSVHKIIIDLRGNPGGVLQSTFDLLDLIFPRGDTLIKTIGKRNEFNEIYVSKNKPFLGNIPIAILIDENSASASEIVAACVQDLDRGVIVGRKSFGKGMVQIRFDLDYFGTLVLTTSKYYTPSGRTIQKLNYLEKTKNVVQGEIKDTIPSVFFTRNKRKVISYDGITPDIIVNQSKHSEITRELLKKGMFFKFVNKNFANSSIKNIESLNKRDVIKNFINFVEKSDFNYTPQYKKTLNELIDNLKESKNFSSELNALIQMQKKIKFNIKDEIQAHLDEIFELILKEIAEQTNNRDLRLKVKKSFDEDLKVALDILKNEKKYREILAVK